MVMLAESPESSTASATAEKRSPEVKTKTEEPPAKRQKTSPNTSDAGRLNFETDCGIFLTCQHKLALKAGLKDFFNQVRRTLPAKLSAEEKEACKTKVTQSEPKEAESKPMDEKLEEEMKQAIFKKTNSTYTVLQHKDVPMGCAFIKVKREVLNASASEVVSALLEKYLDKTEKSKEIGRLIPCDTIMAPAIEAFQDTLEKIIKPGMIAEIKKLQSEDTSADVFSKFTWCLQHKSRGQIRTKEGKQPANKERVLCALDTMMEQVAREFGSTDAAKKAFRVSINNPTLTINVEVNPLFCGVSLLKNWGKLMKYNVQSCMNPEKAKAETVRQQKDYKEKMENKADNIKKETEVKQESEVKKEEPATEKAPVKSEETKSEEKATTEVKVPEVIKKEEPIKAEEKA